MITNDNIDMSTFDLRFFKKRNKAENKKDSSFLVVALVRFTIDDRESNITQDENKVRKREKVV